MATVRVARADAEHRRLPLVSVHSGRPGQGYAVAGRRPLVVRVPLTQPEFDRLLVLERRRQSAVWGGVGCVALGVAMARFPVMLPLALVIGALSLVLWILAAAARRRLLPRVEPGGRPDVVVLRGVHRDFVAAVESAGGVVE